MKQFYQAGYDYTQTDQYENADQITKTVVKGQLFMDPYTEHIAVVAPGDTVFFAREKIYYIAEMTECKNYSWKQ